MQGKPVAQLILLTHSIITQFLEPEEKTSHIDIKVTENSHRRKEIRNDIRKNKAVNAERMKNGLKRGNDLTL